MKSNNQLFLEKSNKKEYAVGAGVGGALAGLYAVRPKDQVRYVSKPLSLEINPVVKEFFDKYKIRFPGDDTDELMRGKMDPTKARGLLKKINKFLNRYIEEKPEEAGKKVIKYFKDILDKYN